MTEGTANRKSTREVKWKKEMQALIEDVLDVEPENSIVEFLAAQGYKNIQGIFTLDDETINSGCWVDKKDVTQKLTPRERIELKVIRAWNIAFLDEADTRGDKNPVTNWGDREIFNRDTYEYFLRNRYLRATTS